MTTTTRTAAQDVERRRERVERLAAELRDAERQLETAEQALESEPDDFGPKYPDIHVQLTGQDGNAFTMITRVMGDMRAAKVPVEERDAFMAEVTSGDYDHVIQTIMRWVDVC